jgi:hypothetical protein
MYRSHAGDMGPVSLVAYPWQKFSLSLLLHWLAWDRNWVRTRGSVGRHAEDCAGSSFSREQWDLSKSVSDSQRVSMRWPCEICMVWDHTRTERGMCVACWLGFPLHGVQLFESPWLSDISTACLWQSSRRQLNELNELICNRYVLLTTLNCLQLLSK